MTRLLQPTGAQMVDTRRDDPTRNNAYIFNPSGTAGITYLNKVSTNLSASSPQTIATPQTTALNDCLIVVACGQGTAGFTASGGGATWTEAFSNNAGPCLAVWVGYGCTAGNTSFVLSYTANAGTVGCAQFSGIRHASNPVITGTATSQATTATVTTASVAYAAGNLVLAAVGVVNPGTWDTTTWSDSLATTNLMNTAVAAGRDFDVDILIPGASGNTTATFTWTNSANPIPYGICVIQQAP